MQKIIINSVELAEIKYNCLYVSDFISQINNCNELNNLVNRLNKIISEYKSLGYAVIYKRYV